MITQQSPLTKSEKYAIIHIKSLKGLIIIFNRNEHSWHESNLVDEINLKRFKDEYSAKYLNKVYAPEFRLRMVPKNAPKIAKSFIAVGAINKKYANKLEIF